jgi:hypothetical protein
VLLAGGGTAAALVGLACGPSFQVIYEGNARFEHCYALEENGQTAVREKVECWRDWSERYTYGQTRDRINYATARYVALEQMSTAPTDEAMMMGAPGMAPRQSTITAPNPTNAFAPPPKVLDNYDASTAKAPRPSEVPVIVGVGGSSLDAGPGALTSSVPLPGSDCGSGCGRQLQKCREVCTGTDAGLAFVPSASSSPSASSLPAPAASPAPARAAAATKGIGGTCGACEKTYRACMRGCFK